MNNFKNYIYMYTYMYIYVYMYIFQIKGVEKLVIDVDQITLEYYVL